MPSLNFKAQFAALKVAVALFASTDVVLAQPQANDIFDVAPGGSFRGWEITGEGSARGQTYVRFNDGGRLVIALTTPLVTAPNGAVRVQKIARMVPIDVAPSEEFMEEQCNPIDLSPDILIFNVRTRIARGYFIFPGEVRVLRWFVDDPHGCEDGGD